MNELPKVERTTLTMKEKAEYLGISKSSSKKNTNIMC